MDTQTLGLFEMAAHTGPCHGTARCPGQYRPVVEYLGTYARVLLTFGESVTRSRITASLGMAPFPSVPPGPFRIRVEAYGYRPYEDSPADPRVSGEWRLDVELTPLPVEVEGVTVRADPIQIQRENTEFATTVQEEAIQLLPVVYDVTELVDLTPGARAENVWGGASFQANSYRIDGLSANHPGIGGSLLEPSLLWIDRVEIRGLGSGAEHGGFQGGQVNVVTKRGSNVFSGMLRTTGTNDLLSASNLALNEAKSEVKNCVDLEGEVSGPLIRDRLFYYVGGTFTDRSARALNHVDFEGRYSPLSEDLEEVKTFGKLTWTPGPADEISVSGAYLRDDVANYGLTGSEGNGAAPTLLSPTWFSNAEWTHAPYTPFHNPPLTLRSASGSQEPPGAVLFLDRWAGRAPVSEQQRRVCWCSKHLAIDGEGSLHRGFNAWWCYVGSGWGLA